MVITTFVVVGPGGTGFGAKVHLALAGSPAQVKTKVVSVAGFGVIVMCSVASCPAVTMIECNVAAIVKSSPVLIANDRGMLVAGL